MKLKQALKGKIPKEALEHVRSSFDIVGDIAVLEIPEEVKDYEKVIAKKVLETHKNVKVVAKKQGPTKGKKRIRKIKVIAGEKRTKTVHKENGIRLNVDINKAFFTPRLGTERQRVLSLVKKGEVVADLFSGVGPYAVLIAKKSKAKKVIANDINKSAVKLLKGNAVLNKIENMEIYSGDAKKVVKEHKIRADRVIMNIPKFSENFLDVAFLACKKGGVVHFYYFEAESEDAKKTVKNYAKEHRKKIRILRKVECGDLAPGVKRVCVDFKTL